jgi:type IV pilus assembly protein PilV
MMSHELVGRRGQRGVSLVEVLVSALILGLALISLARLQAYTTQYQVGSANRAVQSILVSDLAERVRANLPGAPGYRTGLVGAYVFNTAWADQQATPDEPVTDCGHERCSDPQTLAAYDMAVWRAKVREQLPAGSVYVTGDIHQGMHLTLMWQDVGFVKTATDGKTREVDRSTLCDVRAAGMAAQHCCPADVQAEAGVRCANFVIVP